jgi:hypothetical protein
MPCGVEKRDRSGKNRGYRYNRYELTTNVRESVPSTDGARGFTRGENTMRSTIGGMDLFSAGLLLIVIIFNWRDWRSVRAKGGRWTLSGVTRRRAVVLILCPLLLWGLTALAIFIELSSERPDWGVVLLVVPVMLGLQICLFRRSELFQLRADAETIPYSQEERGA